ncbi:MAG: UDP-glucose 4-epimerase GalE [Magnetospirillum sp.]|nr:MAG: UDP-glucose 4-epimerase GalE [Magnetospirillum sp.]
MEKGCVLVTGGAGYIGSHVALELLDHGWRVVILDNLTTGDRRLVPAGANFVNGDAGDFELVTGLLRRHNCGAVLHFAGSTVVPESVGDPLAYYRNNTVVSRTLIAACVAAGVFRFIFSSTAAVYGDPDRLPVREVDPTRPLSPYGNSKLCTEMVLRDVDAATPLRYVALRYFNVAGADPEGRSGQSTPQATHLVKVACEVATGRREAITIHGVDYDTPDGTCVRDFVHVSDLATAHVAALRHLMAGGGSRTLNCGYGHGFSVREIVETTRRLSGRPMVVHIGPRRPGDIVAMVADTARIRRELAWTPRFVGDMDAIVGSALAWEKNTHT